jgi:DNA primase catalytic subunit
MKKQKQVKISFEECYKNLKNLIEQKINLEQENKQSSTNYYNVKKDIQKLMSALSFNDLKAVKVYCKVGKEDLNNIYKSDISGRISEQISNKLNVNYACSNVLNEYLKLSKNNEITR